MQALQGFGHLTNKLHLCSDSFCRGWKRKAERRRRTRCWPQSRTMRHSLPGKQNVPAYPTASLNFMKSERPSAAEYGGIGRPPMEISPLPMVEGFAHIRGDLFDKKRESTSRPALKGNLAIRDRHPDTRSSARYTCRRNSPLPAGHTESSLAVCRYR